MIDPHVHCRDWEQSYKETIEHALSVAERAGLSGIFDMPNTDPAITTRELIEKRLEDADKTSSKVFYGLYAGSTSDKKQIKKVVKAWRELFPYVVGLKMFAGHSVGNLGIIKEDEQKLVYQTLVDEGFTGVLAVHCEKESYLEPRQWYPRVPSTHSYARPPISKIRSIENQIDFICHVSVPSSVNLIEEARKSKIKITCGITPHHCLLSNDCTIQNAEGLLYKVNPPLRDKHEQTKMLELLKQGKINWIETDHAPHTLKEKLNSPYMSGFPGLPFYPHFLDYLRTNGFLDEQIINLTHKNICDTFGINLPERNIIPNRALHTEYEVDVYKDMRNRK